MKINVFYFQKSVLKHCIGCYLKNIFLGASPQTPIFIHHAPLTSSSVMVMMIIVMVMANVLNIFMT